MQSFLSLGLPEPLAQGLAALGFEGPTAIQSAAIPALLSGRDLLMESETGTGKTFAYLAPALALAAAGLSGRKEGPAALIAAPTQELAVQIGREAERLAKASGLELPIAVLLGGTPIVKQELKLKERPVLVVGTLGRLADLVALRKLRVASLKLLVLDEADRILAPEAEELGLALLKAAPRDCCRVLASATLPDRTRRSAAPFLRDPLYAEIESKPVLAGDIEHWCFYCDSRKRVDFIRRFEAAVAPTRCLVFLSNASRVESVVERLAARDLPVEGIHARLEKEERRHALDRFAAGELRYLVTSDLGARGLDIAGISHVLSLDLPEEGTVYVHRAGRTGRAGAKGVSVVLVDQVELQRASRIAVRQGFSFRTKVLEGGNVLEPKPEEFFALVESAEAERRASRAKRAQSGEARASARPAARASDRPRAGTQGPARPYRGEERPLPPTGAIPGQRRPAFDRPRPAPDQAPASGLPSRPAARPQRRDAAPQQSGPAPHQSGPAPQRSGPAPQRSGAAPQRSDAAPQQSGSAPQQSGSAPLRSGARPQRNDAAPHQSGAAPQRSGSTPQRTGAASHQSGAGAERPAPKPRGKAARKAGEGAGKAARPTRSGAERRLAEKGQELPSPERRLGKKEREAERKKDWPGHRKPGGKTES